MRTIKNNDQEYDLCQERGSALICIGKHVGCKPAISVKRTGLQFLFRKMGEAVPTGGLGTVAGILGEEVQQLSSASQIDFSIFVLAE